MLIGSFAALPTMPVLTKLLPLPDAVLAFLASVATLESMVKCGGYLQKLCQKTWPHWKMLVGVRSIALKIGP